MRVVREAADVKRIGHDEVRGSGWAGWGQAAGFRLLSPLGLNPVHCLQRRSEDV